MTKQELDQMRRQADIEQTVSTMLLNDWTPRDGSAKYDSLKARALAADAEVEALSQMEPEMFTAYDENGEAFATYYDTGIAAH